MPKVDRNESRPFGKEKKVKAGKKVKKPARDVNVNQTVHVHVTKRRSAPRQQNPFATIRSGNPMHQYQSPMPSFNQFSPFVSGAGQAPHNLMGSILAGGASANLYRANPYAPVRASQPMMSSIGTGPDGDAFSSRLAPELLYPRVASIDMPSSVPRRADSQLVPTRLTTYEYDGKEDAPNFSGFQPMYKQELANSGFVNNPSINPANWLYGNYPEQHFSFSEFNIRNPFGAPVATQSPEAQLPQSMLALEYKPDNQIEEELPPPIATASASDRNQAPSQSDMQLYDKLNRQYNIKELQEYMRSVGLAPGKKFGRSKDELLRRLVEHLSTEKP